MDEILPGNKYGRAVEGPENPGYPVQVCLYVYCALSEDNEGKKEHVSQQHRLSKQLIDKVPSNFFHS